MNGNAENRLLRAGAGHRRPLMVAEPPPEPGPNRSRVRNRLTLIYPGADNGLLAESEADGRERPLGCLALGVVERAAPVGPGAGELIVWNGPHADYGLLDPEVSLWATVPGEEARLLPAGIGAEAQEGLQAALETLDRRPGHCVVLGQGMLGHLAAQWLRWRGSPVIVVENSPKRLEFSKYAGLTARIDTHNLDWRERLKRRAPEGVDLLVDACGYPAPVLELLSFLNEGGVLCRLGQWRQREGPESPVEQALAARRGRAVGPPPTFGQSRAQRKMLARWISLIAGGEIATERLLTHHIRPEEAPLALKRLATGVKSWLGVVIDWRSEAAAEEAEGSPPRREETKGSG